MHDKEYGAAILFFPREVAAQRLPLGLPMGPLVEGKTQVHLTPGIAEKKAVPADFREHILKFLPQLRNPLFRLGRSADYLEGLVTGSLQPGPLLDVKGTLDKAEFARLFQLRVRITSGPHPTGERRGGGRPDAFAVAENALQLLAEFFFSSAAEAEEA